MAIALGAQELAVDHGQIARAQRQSRQQQTEDAEHQVMAAGVLQAGFATAGGAGGAAAIGAHGRTIMTSCGAGERMPSSSTAILPMRP